jgi:3'(2'), 5'-bisphosphate nucleotidase
MPGIQDPNTLLPDVRAIAHEAGHRILEVYEHPFKVAEKADGSPLTEADRAAHELIVQRLEHLTPAMPVLSEESAALGYEQRAAWTRFWLVDPLDGTKEFVKRNDEFSVNIALIENGRPVLGVVLAPAMRIAYWACVGAGAFRQAVDGTNERIHARRYLGGRATVALSRSHPGKRTAGFLESLAQREGQPRTLSMGSALKMCLLAEGSADVYVRFGPTSEWDTAAAQCVLEVAGGQVRDLHKQPLAYNKPSLLNPWFLACGAGEYDWWSHVHE